MRQTRQLKMQRCEETLGERDVGGYTARTGGSFPEPAQLYHLSLNLHDLASSPCAEGSFPNDLWSRVVDGGRIDGWLCFRIKSLG
jgi:hypothetical protein